MLLFLRPLFVFQLTDLFLLTDRFLLRRKTIQFPSRKELVCVRLRRTLARSAVVYIRTLASTTIVTVTDLFLMRRMVWIWEDRRWLTRWLGSVVWKESWWRDRWEVWFDLVRIIRRDVRRSSRGRVGFRSCPKLTTFDFHHRLILVFVFFHILSSRFKSAWRGVAPTENLKRWLDQPGLGQLGRVCVCCEIDTVDFVGTDTLKRKILCTYSFAMEGDIRTLNFTSKKLNS